MRTGQNRRNEVLNGVVFFMMNPIEENLIYGQIPDNDHDSVVVRAASKIDADDLSQKEDIETSLVS